MADYTVDQFNNSVSIAVYANGRTTNGFNPNFFSQSLERMRAGELNEPIGFPVSSPYDLSYE